MKRRGKIAGMTKQSIFIEEVRGHQDRYKRLFAFTHSSTKAAGIMLLAAVAALIIANTEAYAPFLAFWETEVGFFLGDMHAGMSLSEVINDILMAIFFLLVGLEIKYEMTVGELTNIRQAILPIMAAVGGVCAPIGIYLVFNAGNPDTVHGWGVPTATDIAFALGILALLGNRVPNGVRVFLSTLAVADDIIAIIIIAVFYGQTPNFLWLAGAAVVLVVLFCMNRAHVYSLPFYLIVGVVLWYCVFMSGIHSTIAGVLLAFTIPGGSRVNLRGFISWSQERVARAASTFQPEEPVIGQTDYLKQVTVLSRISQQVIPPATRLERKLYPWVYFFILPLFALTNADVCFAGLSLSGLVGDSVLVGVFLGLLLGKPIGIMFMSFVVVKTRIASLPENVNWLHMVGAAILGGVGFTMAIFVANLGFSDPAHIVAAKVGILGASALAGICGFCFLTVQARAAQKRGMSFVHIAEEDAVQQTADIEDTRDAERIIGLRRRDSAIARRLREIQRQNVGVTEMIIRDYGRSMGVEILKENVDVSRIDAEAGPSEIIIVEEPENNEEGMGVTCATKPCTEVDVHGMNGAADAASMTGANERASAEENCEGKFSHDG